MSARQGARAGTCAAIVAGILAISCPPSPVHAGAPDGCWNFTPIVTRMSASSCIDSVGDRMLVFGGNDGYSVTNQTMQMSLSNPELGWHPLLHGSAVPAPRSSAASAWDPVRRRWIVFGGTGASAQLNDVWVLSLANTPEWRRLSPLGSPPATRAGAACAYDPKHDRLLVFGGSSGSTRQNDVWALSLSGTPRWDSLAAGGTPPTPRSSAAAMFDVKRDRFLVVGGYDGVNGGSMTVHALSNDEAPSWSTLAASGAPSARYSQAAIYDPQRDELVLFGGLVSSMFTSFYVRNDLLVLSLAGQGSWSTWAAVGSTPSPRYGVSAAFDARRSRICYFGGSELYDGPPASVRPKGETYTLQRPGSTGWSLHSTMPWTVAGAGVGQLVFADVARNRVIRYGGLVYGYAPLPSPISPRMISLSDPSFGWQSYFHERVSGHPGDVAMSGVLDSPRRRLILFGGRNGGNNSLQNATSEWILAGPDSERVLAPTGTPPSVREYHAAIADPVAQRMIVFGGQNGTTRYSDLWQLTLSGPLAWTALSPSGTPPSARSGHSAVYDPVRRRMIVFGGRNASVAFRDVFALDLAGAPAWSPVVTTGPAPAPRYQHAAVFDEVNDRMLVFGGGGTNLVPYDTTWALVFSPQPHWVPLVTDGVGPVPGWFNALLYDPLRRAVVSIGGNVASQTSLSVFSFLTGGPSLLSVNEPASPAPTAPGLQLTSANPMRDGAELRWTAARGGPIELVVLDVAGRTVRRLERRSVEAGSGSARWDGCDDAGARVSPGIYFARLSGIGAAGIVRMVVLR